MDPAVRLEAEPDVRCGGDEPFELLRCDKRPASESVSDARRVKRIKNEIPKEDLNMTTEQGMVKTMTIEGMMCGHCEARVKKTLEAIEGVASAEVSHEKGTAVVTLTAPVSDDVLKTAVEAQDYTVKGIQ